jgi:cbb3-type cytochrome oxidase cytochrome c subunit
LIAIALLPIFIVLIAAIAVAIAFLVFRLGRSRKRSPMKPPTPLETQQRVIREEVVKKEVIVKVRCSYCHAQFDETLDKCPNCGATH